MDVKMLTRSSAKIATFLVKVSHTQVIHYKIKIKTTGNAVDATKFECVLTSASGLQLSGALL